MMETSEQLNELFTALSRAQGEIRPALKDRENPHLRSKYADLGSVWEACRDVLARHGLTVTQWPLSPEGASGITLMTILGHTSGQYIRAAYTMPVGKGDAQSHGSALTYARRYALSAVLGIVADDDDDGQAASRPPARQPDRSKDDLPIGPHAPRLEAELRALGIADPLTYAARVCRIPDLADLAALTVRQARQVKHAASGQAQRAGGGEAA